MGIASCGHRLPDSYIAYVVIYDDSANNQVQTCPVCAMEKHLEDIKEKLEGKIEENMALEELALPGDAATSE